MKWAVHSTTVTSCSSSSSSSIPFPFLRANTRHRGDREGSEIRESRRRRRRKRSGRGRRPPGRISESVRDGASEGVEPEGRERAVVRGERAGRRPRLDQRRLLGRRRDPRLLPLGQTRAPAPEGAAGRFSLANSYCCCGCLLLDGSVWTCRFLG